MPKVRFKGPVVEIRGVLYDVVFKRSSTGKMIVTKRPDMSNVEWSDAQIAQRKRFALASAYATAAMADPTVRASYERKAKRRHKRARDIAFSDYCKGIDLLAKKPGRSRRKKPIDHGAPDPSKTHK